MSQALPPEQHARIVYSYVVGYLERMGWRREGPGEGWWWKEDEDALLQMGEALDVQLMADGVDLREKP